MTKTFAQKFWQNILCENDCSEQVTTARWQTKSSLYKLGNGQKDFRFECYEKIMRIQIK